MIILKLRDALTANTKIIILIEKSPNIRQKLTFPCTRAYLNSRTFILPKNNHILLYKSSEIFIIKWKRI